MPDTTPPIASVVITSRNRKDDLLVAIDSCLHQSVPVEVLVFDDASTDGGAEAVRRTFPEEQLPQVRLFPEEKPVGYIVLRNRGAQLAKTNYIISIDDDAIFTTPTVVEETIKEFANPRIGAIAIPFQNIRISEEIFHRAPDRNDIYITAVYIGTAHAVRRDLFLQLGGYRESLVHQGEELDYCIRLLNAGYVVRLGSSDQIHHFMSPKRDMTRLHYYGTRNNILFIWYNVPVLQRPIYFARSTVANVLHGWRVKGVSHQTSSVTRRLSRRNSKSE